MSRIDYLDDPNAPKANNLVPAASAIVLDDADRILLCHRTDNDYWTIPGGGMEPGESIALGRRRFDERLRLQDPEDLARDCRSHGVM